MKNRLFFVLSALASGALYTFANVGYGQWYLAFFAFVPLLLALERNGNSLLGSAVLAFSSGCIVYVVGYSWLFALAGDFVNGQAESVAMWSGYGFLVALNFAFLGLIYSVLRRAQVPLVLSFCTALVLHEAMQFNLFPFYFGASMVHSPGLAQAADLGGVYLLSALLAVVNACVAGGILHLERESLRAMAHLVSAAICVSFLYLYGLSIKAQGEDVVEQKPNNQRLHVGLVQSNLYGIARDAQRVKAHRHHVELSRELLSDTSIDLLIWPEAAYGHGIKGPLPLDGSSVQQGLDTAILFGSNRVLVLNGEDRAQNSVFLVEQNSKIEQVYSKNKLIPFSEYLPFANGPSFAAESMAVVFPEHQNFLAGNSIQSIEFNGRNMSTPICYEAVMPDLVRDMVNENSAELLVSVANDSWFGQSREPYIHLALARLRAIEHRRWFVRVANSGISAVIDPQGRLVNIIPLGIEGVRSSMVEWRSERTLFTRFGNWPLTLLLLVTALFLGIRFLLFKRGAKTCEAFFVRRSQFGDNSIV